MASLLVDAFGAAPPPRWWSSQEQERSMGSRSRGRSLPGTKTTRSYHARYFSGWAVHARSVYNLEHNASKSEHNRKRPGQETMQSCKSIQVHIN